MHQVKCLVLGNIWMNKYWFLYPVSKRNKEFYQFFLNHLIFALMVIIPNKTI